VVNVYLGFAYKRTGAELRRKPFKALYSYVFVIETSFGLRKGAPGYTFHIAADAIR